MKGEYFPNFFDFLKTMLFPVVLYRKKGGCSVPSILSVDADLHLRKLVLTYAKMENCQ